MNQNVYSDCRLSSFNYISLVEKKKKKGGQLGKMNYIKNIDYKKLSLIMEILYLYLIKQKSICRKDNRR